jgi:hypothetical protein
MRIVENNNTIRVVCEHCKSVLAVTVEDIKDAMEVGAYCVCAACDKPTKIPLASIPKHWRYQLWDE